MPHPTRAVTKKARNPRKGKEKGLDSASYKQYYVNCKIGPYFACSFGGCKPESGFLFPLLSTALPSARLARVNRPRRNHHSLQGNRFST